MQTGDNKDYFKKNHVSAEIFKDYLKKTIGFTKHLVKMLAQH
jgi:hypothetical protein